MFRNLTCVLAITAILAGSLSMTAEARPDRQENKHGKDTRAEQRDDRGRQDGREHSRKGVLTRDEAARRAQRRYGGRVLSVDLLQSDDAPARYRIKLLSNGNVRTVDVDALED